MADGLLGLIAPQVDLGWPGKDGATRREHLESYARQSGRWPRQLDPPDVPFGAEHLWDWFWQIIGGKGAEEGFWVCLRAWSEMSGVRPSMWEVGILRRMHAEYQKAVDAKMREK